MSTADQEQVRAQAPEAGAGGRGSDAIPAAGRSVDPPSPEGAAGETAAQGPGTAAPAAGTATAGGVTGAAETGADETGAAGPAGGASAGHKAAEGEPGPDGNRLTPRQARRLRIALSSLGMAVMAVVLWMRIASRSSVLVVGVYGLALILCGIVMELSRNGRTRLASWLLGVGLLAAVGTDWLLLP
ncbi:hypothetical protein ACFYPN_24530 [Streptomyces sp. NPDC005576]|uniref:hypothetical protein n=1 Tax=Streptomyces sp. NPDC005576 TaxID=3364726 RepID=UPI00368DE344